MLRVQFSSDIFFSYPSHFCTYKDKALQNFTYCLCWYESCFLISRIEHDVKNVGEQTAEEHIRTYETTSNRSLEKKLHDEELHSLYSPLNIITPIHSRSMRQAGH
jgi:hypothetical protein